MISLKNISKIYGKDLKQLKALDDLSLMVKSGEALAILGPSGSGKSTLMDVIGTITTPDSGRYLFNNNDTSLMTDNEKAALRNKSFGFVFQAFHLLPSLTVLENVLLPAKYSLKKDPLIRRRALSSLEAVGMKKRADSLPKTLSGGEQQRVAIARSLILQPEIILADEPTGNLDSKNGRNIIEILLKQWQSGSTLIMITHNEELASMFPRVIRILDGKIASDQRKDKE